MKIKTDTELTIKLPTTVEVSDYHEFKQIEDLLHRLGAKRARVTEIGCNDFGHYVGLVHTSSAQHRRLAEQMIAETFER
jgi:hypothetical protein